MKSFLTKSRHLLSSASHLPESLILLIGRLAIFSVFWRSAQTKISGAEFLGQSWAFYDLNASTLLLFEYDYDLPLIPPDIAAYLATFAEFFLSLFILVGLFSRLSAAGFLVMTLVIQLFVYPGAWPTHLLWAALLVSILKHGPGKVSVDYLISGGR